MIEKYHILINQAFNLFILVHVKLCKDIYMVTILVNIHWPR